MLEVEPIDRHGHVANESGQNRNKAVTSATSEAFTSWLHRQICPHQTAINGHVFLRKKILLVFSARCNIYITRLCHYASPSLL